MVSHFLCGVAVPPDLPGDKPQVFHSFSKVYILMHTHASMKALHIWPLCLHRIGIYVIGNFNIVV